MQAQDILRTVFAGALIGAAASLLLLSVGRVAGVSGMVASVLRGPRSGADIALAFLLGLIGAGALGWWFTPELIAPSPRALPWVAVAGVLVGVGTRLGSGCTSGHGVCGVSRLSVRSILATLTFIATGMLGVLAQRALGVAP